MSDKSSSKPILSAICFVASAAVAGITLSTWVIATIDRHVVAPNTLIAGSIALLAAAISGRSVEGR